MESRENIKYTKKVIRYFTHPKNVGEIKNADGVGKVGNMTCLIPWQKIHSNPSLIEIEKLNAEHFVLNHEGKYDKINGNYSRKYSGEIIELKNNLGKIRLTPEHLIFAIKTPRDHKFLRNKWRKTLIPSWYHAADLSRRDIILYPIQREIKNVKTIGINIAKLKYDFKSKSIPKKVMIDNDFLRLAGYYLAEGHASLRTCNVCITFTFNIKEKDYILDIQRIMKRLFDLDIIIKKRPKNKTAVIYVHNAPLTRFFNNLFGKGAENKKIPNFMMFLPPEKQKSLIKGLWRGYGYINLNRNGPRAGYATISYTLVQQLKVLLLRQGIVPSIYEEEEKITKGVKHRKSFRIHVGQRESLIKLCKIFGLEYRPKSYASVDSWFDNNYLCTPITGKKEISYKGIVHNLEVQNSHSFTSEAFCLHNCGDIMHVFIKVGKKKIKGEWEEFIKDIKFKTLGCAAAIATSSIVTELAKGKTLREAIKITNKDVVKTLGGLPLIKVHCSLLAEEALGEAIYNYMKKNKKKIPLELEKKHKRALETEKEFGEKFHNH